MVEESEKPTHSFIRLLISYFEKILFLISGVSLVIMAAVILYGVFGRMLGLSVVWTNELATYLMIYVTYMAAPWVLKQDGHVKVDIFLTNLKPEKLYINGIFVSLVCIFINGIFFWYSLKHTLHLFQRGTKLMGTLPIPEYVLFIPIVFGSLFLVLRFILKFLDDLFNYSQSKNSLVKEGE